jgi:hypothetical protein
MIWSALLPGLREIRGPLLAGYLWILAVWLLLGAQLPNSHSNEVFERLWEAGEAIGPIGRAAAASVIAYLIGTLLNGAIGSSVSLLFGMARLWSYSRRVEVPGENDASKSSWLPITELLEIQDTDLDDYFSGPSSMATLATLANLEQAELSGARAGLEGGVKHAQAVSENSARYKPVAERGNALVIALPRPDRDLLEVVVPTFSPHKDILAKRSLLKTRLRELAPPTASKIEQIDSEADFRENLIGPLALLVLIFGFQASPAWCALLIIPVALFVQVRALRKAAARELVDALRARSGTEDLEKITPVFRNYRADAKRLEEALIEANWKNLKFIEEAIEEDLRK